MIGCLALVLLALLTQRMDRHLPIPDEATIQARMEHAFEGALLRLAAEHPDNLDLLTPGHVIHAQVRILDMRHAVVTFVGMDQVHGFIPCGKPSFVAGRYKDSEGYASVPVAWMDPEDLLPASPVLKLLLAILGDVRTASGQRCIRSHSLSMSVKTMTAHDRMELQAAIATDRS